MNPPPFTPTRKAVFLDRDGTLIPDRGYLADPGGVALFPGVPEALRSLRERGFLLVLVTNQSGIGRGFFSNADLEAVHRRLMQLLERHGAGLDDIFFCPHAPDDACDCRKPKPGMILHAARKWGIDCTASFMVGDSPADMGAGRAAGCRTVCVGPIPCAPPPAIDFHARDLPAAAAWILGQTRAAPPAATAPTSKCSPNPPR